MSAPQTDTPRTDDEIFIASDPGAYVPDFDYVTADFARTLERELSEANRQTEIAKSNAIAMTKMWQGEAEQGESRRLQIEELEKQQDALRGIAERLAEMMSKDTDWSDGGETPFSRTGKTALSELDSLKGES